MKNIGLMRKRRFSFLVIDMERFWNKVSLPDENGCMIWLAGKFPNGYGRFKVSGKSMTVHRVSLILAEGEPSDGKLHAAHAPGICHNRACVAPAHLRWATRKENEADKLEDGTHSRGEQSVLSKLTTDNVIEIRRLYETGQWTQRQLSSRFGVTIPQISLIVNNKRWSWLS